MYNVYETDEAVDDVSNFAKYIIDNFKNEQAVENLLKEYDKQVKSLKLFPNGYRGISIEYRGYEIRMKPFGSYNMFFVVREHNQDVIILRVLKELQNWNNILRKKTEYHFTY